MKPLMSDRASCYKFVISLSISFYIFPQYISLDVNECLVNNGGCQQTCINIPGRRICDCKPGYALKENSETTCAGKS